MTLPDHKFAWESEAWENSIKNDTSREDTTYYPRGELLWAIDHLKDVDYDIAENRYTLAWRFEVKSLDPDFYKAFYVNANNGQVFKTINLVKKNGPANIHFHGTQTIDITWNGGIPPNGYVPLAQDNGRNIHTKQYNGNPWSLSPEEYHGDQDWTDCSCINISSVHWFMQESWDYFQNIQLHSGWDGNALEARAYANHTSNGAVYDPDGYVETCCQSGRAIDIVAHEFTHGVVDHTANLGLSGEPGALDESFADIFGFMIEQHAEGGVNDFTIGEDAMNAVNVRSIQNPNNWGIHYPTPCTTATGQPNTYQGQFWYNTNGPCDQGGKHVNSGVQNHWFYLLAYGGNGTNDNGWQYNVNGIGIDAAANIAFNNLKHHLGNSSNYQDSREGALNAAENLYGNCSYQHRQTFNAWHAVGVGDDDQCPGTGVNTNNDIAKARIYPNPTKNTVHIHFNNRQNRTLTLLSVEGKVIERFHLSANQQTYRMDLSSYKPGLYFIKDQRKEQTSTYKIIKQ